ncbi:unnamed protein product [Kluyveromyces dobzhanskii CBS 2104]|uniref:WGS project CCBQ000000000 data, contig 00107 n=1 Tax=Kluyveromyces dobzhanskii CBS 2104 TaxID=1427455 RepID=A0A0A8L0U1_9SACH|nr:unnamed protein product [Kluyveromyces dobzhanskii CBS 2104]
MGDDNSKLDDGLLTRTYELGLKWMQCGEYVKALNLFSKAMKVSRSYPMEMIEKIRVEAGMPKRCAYDSSKSYHPLYVRLLDSRVSCLMKVGDYGRAVKESQYFCKIEPTSTRAMLRLGKSYELAGRADKAWSTYVGGRELVKTLKARGVLVSLMHEKLFNDRYEELLKRDTAQLDNGDLASEENPVPTKKRVLLEQKMVKDDELDELDGSSIDTHKISASKRVKRMSKDPVKSFPTELVISVMSHLSPSDITSCMLVSKFWYQKLSATPLIIGRLKLLKTNYSKLNSLLRFMKTKQCVNAVIQSLNFSVMSNSEEAKCCELLLNGLDRKVEKMVLQFNTFNVFKILRLLSDRKILSNGLQEFSVFGQYDSGSLPGEDLRFLESVDNLRKLEVIVGSFATPNRSISANRPRQLALRDSSSLYHSLQSIKFIFKDNGRTSPALFKCIFVASELQFINVTKLVVTNCDFRNDHTHQWIKKFPNLTDLWLEKNSGLSLMEILHSLKEPNVFKCLKHFTIRESSTEFNRNFNGQLWPEEQIEAILSNLKTVHTLDFMNSAIAKSVLYRLLNEIPAIRKLNIGNLFELSDELYPRTDVESTAFLFLRQMAHLRDFSIPNMTAHHFRSFRQLSLVLPEIHSLEKLDLSFNPSMQGYQLYDLIREFADNGLTLHTLNIDGCPQISSGTVKDIQSNGFVENMECAFNKQQWEKFGANSFWYR